MRFIYNWLYCKLFWNYRTFIQFCVFNFVTGCIVLLNVDMINDIRLLYHVIAVALDICGENGSVVEGVTQPWSATSLPSRFLVADENTHPLTLIIYLTLFNENVCHYSLLSLLLPYSWAVVDDWSPNLPALISRKKSEIAEVMSSTQRPVTSSTFRNS